jgi:hypothetical protein
MREAAKNFDFERAAALRDRVRALKQRDLGAIFAPAGTDSQPALTEVSASEVSGGPAAGVDDAGGEAEVPASVAPATEQPAGVEPPSVKKRSRVAKVSRKS